MGFFFALLAVALIVLKLTAVIGWPWIWVLAPIWGPFAIWAVIFVIGLIAAAITFGSVSARRQPLVFH